MASDHIIESFRNDLWPGYKTSEGMPPELLAQLPVFEDALDAMGVTVWPMIEFEADDAMAAAAAIAAKDERVDQVILCTPDKDLGQCVVGTRIVQLDRRKNLVIDEDGVREKFGVNPSSIPDYLALVGDTADGFPGLPGFGAKTASAVLARYGHLEEIPTAGAQWDVPGLRHVPRLAETLAENFELALLFRRIATVERDVDVGAVDDWRWTGPTPRFAEMCEKLGSRSLAGRARCAPPRAGSSRGLPKARLRLHDRVVGADGRAGHRADRAEAHRVAGRVDQRPLGYPHHPDA